MDSPLVNRIFRRLFAHDTCSRLRSQRPSSPLLLPQCQQRTFAITARRQRDKKYGAKPQEQESWQPRSELVVDEKVTEFKRYPVVTADELRERKERPRRVKMLMRDFIEGRISQLTHIQPKLTFHRQPIQSALWLLLQTSCHLLPRRTLRLPQDQRRTGLLPTIRPTLFRIRRQTGRKGTQ